MEDTGQGVSPPPSALIQNHREVVLISTSPHKDLDDSFAKTGNPEKMNPMKDSNMKITSDGN